jgi:hypothetical protein
VHPARQAPSPPRSRSSSAPRATATRRGRKRGVWRGRPVSCAGPCMPWSRSSPRCRAPDRTGSPLLHLARPISPHSGTHRVSISVRIHCLSCAPYPWTMPVSPISNLAINWPTLYLTWSMRYTRYSDLATSTAPTGGRMTMSRYARGRVRTGPAAGRAAGTCDVTARPRAAAPRRRARASGPPALR